MFLPTSRYSVVFLKNCIENCCTYCIRDYPYVTAEYHSFTSLVRYIKLSAYGKVAVLFSKSDASTFSVRKSYHSNLDDVFSTLKLEGGSNKVSL